MPRFRSLLCLLMGALAGCQFDSVSGSHLFWADRNTVGQPAVLMEAVRRDVYRREPPQHVVPDQELTRVHADPMLFGVLPVPAERRSESSFEELPPPILGSAANGSAANGSAENASAANASEAMPLLQDDEAEATALPEPAVTTPSPNAGLSSPAPALSPPETLKSNPTGSDSSETRPPENRASETRPPAPSLPQDLPQKTPATPKLPPRIPNVNSADEELHQAVFQLPAQATGNRAENNAIKRGRPPSDRKPVGAWLFSN